MEPVVVRRPEGRHSGVGRGAGAGRDVLGPANAHGCPRAGGGAGGRAVYSQRTSVCGSTRSAGIVCVRRKSPDPSAAVRRAARPSVLPLCPLLPSTSSFSPMKCSIALFHHPNPRLRPQFASMLNLGGGSNQRQGCAAIMLGYCRFVRARRKGGGR